MRRLIQIAGESVTASPVDDRSRREAVEAIRELQSAPLARARVIENVSLADGIETPIPHGLGRAPVFVCPSAPRGSSSSGRIEEIRSTSGTLDRKKYIVLKASGWGATITVDVVAA